MAEAPVHFARSIERWQRMTLHEQLGNLGSEVGRALRARAAGNSDRFQPALERTLELFDLTLADPRHRGRFKEICRAREVLLDFLVGSNDYASTASSIDAYYLQFGKAARRSPGRAER